jgi:alcohol dehydrogenase class IV
MLPPASPESAPEATASAHGALTTQWLPSIQETLQRSMQDRFRALEQQLALEQQRQRDHLEEEVRKVRQHFSVTGREQQQHQQTTLAAFRETLEQMHQEFSAALQHLSEDVTHALRQTEEQTRRALDNLRTEILQLLLTHDPDAVKRQLRGEYLPPPAKPFPSHAEEHRL